MSKHKNEVVVGAIVIFALVLGFFGYVYVQEIPITQKGYYIDIQFENVAGLTDSDPITVSGMKIGRVRSMELMEGFVSVRVWLNDKIALPRDSRATIKNQGMIGEKYIAVQKGKSEEILKNGDVLHGVYENDIADVSSSISGLVNQATTLLNKFNRTWDQNSLDRAKRDALISLDKVSSISAELEQYLSKNTDSFSNTVINLDTLSRRMAAFWKINEDNMDSTLVHVSKASSSFASIVTKLDSVLVVTQALLTKVEKSEGTAGKIIANDEIYEKANKTLDDVQTLLTEIKKQPSKYFNASLIDLF